MTLTWVTLTSADLHLAWYCHPIHDPLIQDDPSVQKTDTLGLELDFEGFFVGVVEGVLILMLTGDVRPGA